MGADSGDISFSMRSEACSSKIIFPPITISQSEAEDMFDLTTRAKPILKWAGGKSGVLSQLVQRFPSSFQRYIEPFAGGSAVFLALKPGHPATLSDTNSELITLYEVVRSQPGELMDCL